MKVAAVGAGNWGKNIVKTLNAMGCLHSVLETNPAQAQVLSQEYTTVPVHGEIGELLESDADAVTIASPAVTHYDLAKKFIEAGKHVFVEKPLTLASKEGQELVDLAKAKGVTLMVGHLLLYQPAIKFIKESIAEGMIGEARSFHQERLNLGRARAAENVLWSLGVHDVAALLYLTDAKPTEVSFSGQAVLQKNIEDDFYLHMKLDNGQYAHLHSSWLWPELRRRLTVIGSQGMLVFDEIEKKVTLHKKSIDSKLANVDGGSEVVYEGSGEPLRNELEHFVECCKTGQKPNSDGESGVEVLKVMELASRSLVPA